MLKFATAVISGAYLSTPQQATSFGTMRTAARAEFNFQPREGFLYVRSRAISNRCNDNFDEFPAEEIRSSYKTFLGKPVFVNHHNASKSRARGFIIATALHEDKLPDNRPDVWAEVLMEIDAQRFPKLAHAILEGHIDRTSMGVDCGETECTACGNVARDPSQYCKHVPSMKGTKLYRTTAGGRKKGEPIREICRKLSFFENSLLVEEPADPTAFVLGVEDHTGQRFASKTASRHHEALLSPSSYFALRRQAMNPVNPNKNQGHGQGDQPTATCGECGGRIYYMKSSNRWIHDDDAGAGVPHDGRPSGGSAK